MLDYLSQIQQSYSVAFADYIRQLELMGQHIIKMQTGEPDFNTHASIVKAAKNALDNSETRYCESRGLPVLRKAIVEKLLKVNNIQTKPETILITHGAVHAIGMAIWAIVNPGDECIIIEPYWRSYEANVVLAGGKPVIVKTSPDNGFQLQAEAVQRKFTDRTKLIIINTPNNPSGAVYKKSELVKLAKSAIQKNILIISDEVYESILFDEKKHYSLASDPTVAEQIVSVFSFSKTHAMTGWRMGYLNANQKIINEILKLSQFSVTSLSPYNQLAALEALTHPEAKAYSESMRVEYEQRRNFIREKIKGTWLQKAAAIPEGTFYVLIDTSRFGKSSLDLAKEIVDFSNVSFTPGIAFGDSMDGFLRLCFATSLENINTAVDALIQFEKK